MKRGAHQSSDAAGAFRRSVSWWLVGAALLAGCSRDAPRLYCGGGLRPPVAELVAEFSRRRGAAIECDYRGSEVLLSTIQLTGEGDLYLPGDVRYVELAEERGLIAFKKTICYFIPVILVAKGNPKKIHGLEDLAGPDVRVGLGDPEACAIGRVSSEIFAKNRLDEKDVSVVVRTVTVNELANHLKLGTLDAAIVWDAVAAFHPEATETVAIPRARNVISTVAAGVLRSAKHPDVAAALLDFLTSPEAKAIFRKHHYTVSLEAEN